MQSSRFYNWLNNKFIISNLGDAINGVINQNFDVISKDIIPLVEKALQRLLKRISSKILENFTYDQVFPQWKFNEIWGKWFWKLIIWILSKSMKKCIKFNIITSLKFIKCIKT